MRHRRIKIGISCLVMTLVCLWTLPSVFAQDTQNNQTLRILFTHDLHSMEDAYKVLTDDKQIKLEGGFARLKTAIDQNKTATTLLVDGGDYSQGSLMNGIYTTVSPDLVLLGTMGYDATTLGNHEFDYGLTPLTQSLTAASSSTIPPVLASNILFGSSAQSQALKGIVDKVGTKTKIVEKNGVKIGLFGLMGQDANKDILNKGDVSFADQQETAKQCVSTLKSQGAQIIVCLSHSGTTEGNDKSEDIELARKVDGIDVIISAHSHRVLEQPISENGTQIVSCGCYGQYLGELDIDPQSKDVKNYKLVSLDDQVAQDQTVTDQVNAYHEDVQSQWLSGYGLTYDQVVAKSNKNFETLETMSNNYGNSDIADLITDAYRWKVGQQGEKPIGLTATGTTRGSIVKGDVTLSDAFNLASVGSGSDGSVGSSMVEAWLTGDELRLICEYDTSMNRKGGDSQLYFSGLRYTYNDSRPLLNKVVDVEVQDSDGNWQAIDGTKGYAIATNSYLAQMVASVKAASHGLLDITLKDKDGNAVSDVKTLILKDKDGKEEKDWMTLVEYFQSFSKDATGKSVIPASYNATRDTKKAVDNSPENFVKNTSVFGWVEYGLGAALIVVVVLIIGLVRRHRKKKAGIKRGKDKNGRF
ncbi:MAG: bifunctional UDP-sugar hydrolase/5'-nucleotidase [Eubacteriaceae bacterium]|nr:bifunctional UDP-sugar hydrolase/5'-nucleotidase [Eubacteriaceae bacterium]